MEIFGKSKKWDFHISLNTRDFPRYLSRLRENPLAFYYAGAEPPIDVG